MWKLHLAFVILWTAALAAQSPAPQTARVRDVVDVEGVRTNPLVGYGLVVGLNGTGDRRQTLFTTQMLANMMQRMGMQIPASSVRVNNVAAVFVTGSLPPFARPGTRLDVTVSSTGDAKSLEGGMLLLTPLRAVDGQAYAEAQGPLTLGGYTAGVSGNSKQVNHPTVARIPAGGIVEREFAFNLQALPTLALLLREPDFATARNIADAVNRDLGRAAAEVRDSGTVTLEVRKSGMDSASLLLARIQDLRIPVQHYAKVVVNERTGTIVLGTDVKIGPVSVLHGSLSIEIATEYRVSQPEPLSRGTTVESAQPTVRATDSVARRMQLSEGATVEQLVSGLQNMGATARDVIAILQAIKAAGALQAELEVL